MVLLFLFLWFYYLDAPFVPEEEGIEVALGDYEEGGADTYEPSAAEPAVVTPAQPAPAAPSSNDLLVQDDEESLQLQKQAEEDRKRKAAEEALREKQRQEELARIEAERLAREQAAAEKAAKEQAARERAQNLMGGRFGNNSGSDGSGNSTGNAQPGSPSGKSGSSGKGGQTVKLAGRVVTKEAPEPKNTTNEEGIIVIRIRVNPAGKVVSATIDRGSDISNPELQEAAKKAAYQYEFNEVEGGTTDVFGTITYRFKLK